MATTKAATILGHIGKLVTAHTHRQLTDRELLRRFTKDRDESAFSAILHKHGPMVLNVCQRTLHNAHDAEDVFQATFLVLMKKAGALSWRESVAGWLHEVAHRLAIRARADARRRDAKEGRVPARAGEDPVSDLTVREAQACLHEELHRLPDSLRAPLVLCYLQGATQDEAARELGWSLRTFKRRLERGRSLLQKRLTRRGISLSVALSTGLLPAAPASAGLIPSTLKAAASVASGKATAAVSASVSAMVDAALRGMFLAKMKQMAALIVLVGLLGTGVALTGSHTTPRADGQQADQPVNPTSKQEPGQVVAYEPAKTGGEKQAVDRFGDPLPPGALFRLGTLRFREQHGWPSQLLPDRQSRLIGTPREIRWLDLATDRLIQSWPLPKGFAVGGFSPDGRLLLLSDRKTLRLWDITARKELRTLHAKGDLGTEVYARFTDDGKFVAVNSAVNWNPGLLRVFDVATGTQLWQDGSMGFGFQGLWDLGFLPDDRTLVILDYADNSISLRDGTTGQKLRSFDTLPRSESRMYALSPDGKTVFFGTAGKTVRTWDLASGKELQSLGEHEPQAMRFAVSRDSKKVLTGGDRFVLVWDWPSAKQTGKIDLGAKRSPSYMRICADGKRAEIVVWGESALRFFDLQTGKELPGPTEAHRSPINGLAIARDGKIVTSGNDNTIRVWDLHSGRQLHEYQSHHPLGATTLSLSPDGHLVATGDYNGGKVLLHERDTGRLLRTIDPGWQQVHSVEFAPNGSLLAISGDAVRPNNQVASQPFFVIWDLKLNREVQRLKPAVRAPIFSPDRRHLACISEGRVQLLEIATGRECRSFPDKDPRNLAFSPDGRVLAIDGPKGFSLWELASGKERWRTQAPAEWARGIRFSPDGRWLGRIDDRIVKLYDVCRGQLVHSFIGHDGTVYRIAFASDGRRLASAGVDTTVLVWDLARVIARQPKPMVPDATAVDAAWKDLASNNAQAAFRALCLLVDGSEHTVPLLREKLRPTQAPDVKRLQGLLGDLSSARFADRERARQELERLDELAEPALQQFLTQDPPLEARRRAEALLDRIQGPISEPKRLQPLRAVEALEYIGRADARLVLEKLAKGASVTRLTREAQGAVQRLAKRLPPR